MLQLQNVNIFQFCAPAFSLFVLFKVAPRHHIFIYFTYFLPFFLQISLSFFFFNVTHCMTRSIGLKKQVLSPPLHLKNRYHFPSLSSTVPMSCAGGFAPSDCTLTENCSPPGWISRATDFNHCLQQLSCVLQYPSAENMSKRTVMSITSPWVEQLGGRGCGEMYCTL